MPTDVIEAENSGDLDNFDSVYATIHDAASSAGFTNNHAFWVGQYYEWLTTDGLGTEADFLEVMRAGLVFDTTVIPTAATIISAILYLYGYADYSDTNFAITLVSGADLADTLVAADFGDLLDDVTSFGIINTSAMVLEDWNAISFNATGITALQTAITAGVKIRFGLRSSRDISSTTPKLYNRVTNTETLRPNAAGDLSELSGTYEDVDEAVADEDATRLSTTSYDPQTSLFNLPDSGVGTGYILGIKVTVRARESVGGVGNARIMVKSGGTVYDYHLGWTLRIPLTDNYADYPVELGSDPATGLAWTWAAINALQVGIELNNDVGAACFCTQIYVEVYYLTPSEAPSYYDDESVYFYGSNTSGKKPKLTIVYSVPFIPRVMVI